MLADELQERICDCRRKTGWGPRLVAGATGFAHSTVWKVLRRHGLSRRLPTVKESANSYEWPCPGDLLHMDTSRYARFLRPGHRVTGDRSQRSRNWMRPETRVGYDFAHAIVDDHSRLAYVELHNDEKAATVTGFLERALAFFAEQGIVAKRLMTDNGFSYVRNRSLRELLARHGIRHLTTQPYRPRTNGKVERFHQTMAREWAYGLSLPLTPPAQPSTATLARPLQPPATTQRNRRPTPDQPRSQRPWVGHLAREKRSRPGPWNGTFRATLRRCSGG